ncbi:MAG: hypothetical protein R2780_14850 [Crocinitomicaceae bacterium]|nr:hypothetical protein [Crocinitomicaceae bacterium]
MKKFRYIIAGAFVIGALVSCEKEEVTTNENEQDQLEQPATKNAESVGNGGSLSQFTIVDDYLYTIDYKTLNIFNLTDPSNPSLEESIDMGVGMETVFHRNGRLFIGSNDGVHIYDISNPRNPQELSQFEHVTSCDPVIANDHIACATLRGGTECGGFLSQLDIIDITDIQNPQLIAEYELGNPYGLGFSNANQNILYICDGNEGLKAFDVSDPNMPELIMTNAFITPKDIIVEEDNNIIVLTTAGVYQFDGSNPTSFVEKSLISVE